MVVVKCLYSSIHGCTLCLWHLIFWADIWHFCEFGVSRPSLHHYAGVRVEQAQPQRAHELLWSVKLPGTLPSMGANGLLSAAWKLHHCGSFG